MSVALTDLGVNRQYSHCVYIVCCLVLWKDGGGGGGATPMSLLRAPTLHQHVIVCAFWLCVYLLAEVE